MPVVRIPLEFLGIEGTPTHGLLHSQAAIATLDFVDAQHVLLTYVARRLLARDEAEGPPVPESSVRERVDRVIHAEVVDVATGRVVHQQDWRVFDSEPYLLGLGGGTFLLRQGSRLSLVDSELHRQTLLDAPKPIVFAQAEIGTGLLAVELEHERHTPTEHAKLAHDALLFNAPRPVEQADLYGWKMPIRQPMQPALFHTLLPQTGVVTGNAEGLIEADGADSGKFEFYFVPLWQTAKAADTTNQVLTKHFVFKTSSDCRPAIRMLRSDVMLVSTCRGTGGMDYAVKLDGTLLWKQESKAGFVPAYANSEDGRRFVVQTVGLQPEPISMLPVIDDYTAGMVQVFDTDTGARLFAAELEPLYAAFHTVAISADGLRLAILRKGAVEVYDLPPLQVAAMPAEAGERARAKEKR